MWQAKAKPEGILDKAAAFDVEVPSGHEEGGGAWLAFYAQVFVLEVRRRHACRLLCRRRASPAPVRLASPRHALTHTHALAVAARPPLCTGVQDEG